MAGKLSQLAGHICLSPTAWNRNYSMSVTPGRLRRLGARASLVGLAMALSGALVVTTPSTAHALAAPPVAPPIIAGAVRTMAPAATIAMNVASVTPWGFALRSVVSLGMLAFSTSDIWMPYVTGTFGAPTDNNSTADVVGSYSKPGFTVNSLSVSGNTFSASYSYSGTSSTWYAYTGAAAACQKPDGTIGYTQTYSYGSRTNSFTSTLAPATMCPGGWTLKGLIVGGGYATPLKGSPLQPAYAMTGANASPITNLAGGSTQYDKGPTNYIEWGSMSPNQGFDAKSPQTTYTVSNECIDSMGTLSTISATTAGDVGALKMPSCEAAGKGHGTGKTAITGLAPGTTIPQPVWDSPRAPSDPATPMCDAARTSGGCTLSIELDGSPCVSGNVECENWSEIQKNDPNNTRLKCRFGPYTLPMSQCAMLEKAYHLGGAPATDANVDGDPGTSSNLDPNGNPIPTRTTPGTTTGTVPGSSGQPDASSDPASSQCFPSGWAMFNPVQWVLQPIRCAFTPSPSTATNLTTRINTKISTVGFAPVAAAWGDAFQSVGGGSGCAGPTVNFSMNGVHQQFQPFNACSGVMAQAAGVSTAVLSLGVIFFGGLGIVRAIGSAFGFNFSMGGKTDGD